MLDSDWTVPAGVLGLCLGFGFGLPAGGCIHDKKLGTTEVGVLQHQQTAIDAGHAEWIVDQKTGERAFKWKTAPEMDWADDDEEAAPK